jgi:hypothetical protein
MLGHTDIADGLASGPSSSDIVWVIACSETCFTTHSLLSFRPFHNLRTTWSPCKLRSVCGTLPAVSLSSIDTTPYRTAMYLFEVVLASNVPSILLFGLILECLF